MAKPKEEVVISGIGLRFPESGNLDEFKELLFNKVNAATSKEKNTVLSIEQPNYS